MASEGDNLRPDAARPRRLLNKTGSCRPVTQNGPQGRRNADLERSIRKFQTDHGLFVDGVLKPAGQMISALRTKMPAIPISRPAGLFGQSALSAAPCAAAQTPAFNADGGR
jgi:peptidoglycan hydrolase-like protein with peptidoglycan-binding domain